jgi:hypothetical protein
LIFWWTRGAPSWPHCVPSFRLQQADGDGLCRRRCWLDVGALLMLAAGSVEPLRAYYVHFSSLFVCCAYVQARVPCRLCRSLDTVWTLVPWLRLVSVWRDLLVLQCLLACVWIGSAPCATFPSSCLLVPGLNVVPLMSLERECTMRCIPLLLSTCTRVEWLP